MSKQIKFEKRYIQISDGFMRVTVKQDGIMLGCDGSMSVEQVKDWIKRQEEQIEEKKDDIRVAEAAIDLFTKEFSEAV
jgi:hypothetical protein